MAQRARVASNTAFLDAAREWRAADIAAMARELPNLVAMRDDSGRTALHVCSRRQPKGAADTKRALATTRALVAAGADINAIQEIPDDGEFTRSPTTVRRSRDSQRARSGNCSASGDGLTSGA